MWRPSSFQIQTGDTHVFHCGYSERGFPILAVSDDGVSGTRGGRRSSLRKFAGIMRVVITILDGNKDKDKKTI